MKPRDARMWHGARTLDELGELTARWLEGDLRSQPGYMPNHGPEPETLELIPTLAAINRLGFVTKSSQPGLFERADPTSDTSPMWWQRAGVYGFADTDLSAYLAGVAEDEDLIVQRVRAVRRPWWRALTGQAPDRGYPVTGLEDDIRTHFGRPFTRRQIEFEFEGCHDKALAALASSWQLTIIDPDAGRNDRLWPLLDKVAAQ